MMGEYRGMRREIDVNRYCQISMPRYNDNPPGISSTSLQLKALTLARVNIDIICAELHAHPPLSEYIRWAKIRPRCRSERKTSSNSSL